MSAWLRAERESPVWSYDFAGAAARDAGITKMKDKRTRPAHSAEHAVDRETGAVVAVALAAADEGDTATLQETVPRRASTLPRLLAQPRMRRSSSSRWRWSATRATTATKP